MLLTDVSQQKLLDRKRRKAAERTEMLEPSTSWEENVNGNEKPTEIRPSAKWSLTRRQSIFKVNARLPQPINQIRLTFDFAREGNSS
jgi:hypothetical protein